MSKMMKMMMKPMRMLNPATSLREKEHLNQMRLMSQERKMMMTKRARTRQFRWLLTSQLCLTKSKSKRKLRGMLRENLSSRTSKWDLSFLR